MCYTLLLLLSDEKEFYFWEILVLVFKLVVTGLFCIIASNSPFQAILAFLVSAFYACLLLRYTPYESDDADALALSCSFALTLTYLSGYVISSVQSSYNDEEDKKDLVEHMFLLDNFLLAINVLPFVVFLYNFLRRTMKATSYRNKNNDDDDNARALSTSTTKITPLNGTQLKKDNVLQMKAQKGQKDGKYWN